MKLWTGLATLGALVTVTLADEEVVQADKRRPLPGGRPLTDFRPGKRSMAVGRQEFRPGKRFVAHHDGGDGVWQLYDRPLRSMALGRFNFRPGKRSMALGRLQFRPGKRFYVHHLKQMRHRLGVAKRSMALGRFNFRPGKRSMALGRFNFRPGKRAPPAPDMCAPNEVDAVVYLVHDLLTLLNTYSDYIEECEGPLSEDELAMIANEVLH